MSVMGQAQTFSSVRITSALLLITDSWRTSREVRDGPEADVLGFFKIPPQIKAQTLLNEFLRYLNKRSLYPLYAADADANLR